MKKVNKVLIDGKEIEDADIKVCWIACPYTLGDILKYKKNVVFYNQLSRAAYNIIKKVHFKPFPICFFWTEKGNCYVGGEKGCERVIYKIDSKVTFIS